MEYESVRVWECDYCHKEFKTKKQCDKHERTCPKKKNSKERQERVNTIKDMLFTIIAFGMAMGIIIYVFNPSNEIKLRLPKLPTRPTLTQPVPTSDPDPYVICSWDKFDDGTSCPEKRMKQSACDDSVCCGLGNGTASPMNKIDCAEFQANIKQPEIIYRQQLPAPQFIQHEVPKIPAIEPPNIKCNFDYLGNWVCKPSY